MVGLEETAEPLAARAAAATRLVTLISLLRFTS